MARALDPEYKDDPIPSRVETAALLQGSLAELEAVLLSLSR
jgi:hypothetical protein